MNEILAACFIGAFVILGAIIGKNLERSSNSELGFTQEIKQEIRECRNSLTLRKSECYLVVVNPETKEEM